MSTEKYATYADAYREFRMNISENDFHDDYPSTREMTIAICSGLRYRFIYHHRELTVDQTVQLIETFAKRVVELDKYKKHRYDNSNYTTQGMITHTYVASNLSCGYVDWMLLCHMYGLLELSPEQKDGIQKGFANKNRYAVRNTIQLKRLQKEINKRIAVQNRLKEAGSLVNSIDEFNHIYKYLNIPSVDIKTGDTSYKIAIDSYYDGQVDERLGTDTIYEWILDDNLERFQEWYSNDGLNMYRSDYHGTDKTRKFIEDIAEHILRSSATNIIRFIIMNRVPEFLNRRAIERYALMDPWYNPVDDPECFRLLQAHFHDEHLTVALEYLEHYDHLAHSFYQSIAPVIYRCASPGIADAIYREIVEIASNLNTSCTTIEICFYEAMEAAKFGHNEPIESLDWDALRSLWCGEEDIIESDSFFIQYWFELLWPRDELLHSSNVATMIGMNPSTAVYLHDLLDEHGITRDSLRPYLQCQLDNSHSAFHRRMISDSDDLFSNDDRIISASYAYDQTVSDLTDDELYW